MDDNEEEMFLRVMPEEIVEEKLWTDCFKAKKDLIETAKKCVIFGSLAIATLYIFLLIFFYFLP